MKAASPTRTGAASAILDRGWGRPEQSLPAAVTGESYIDFLREIAEEEAEDVEALPAEALGTL